MQERKVIPRATITKSMPLQDYNRMTAPPQKEMSFQEKLKLMSQRVLLKHFEDQFKESLKGKKEQKQEDSSNLQVSTNDSLVRC